MTNDDVEMIIKRHMFIAPAIRDKIDCAVFYIGNRKFTVQITQSVIAVCNIISDVYAQIKDPFFKDLVGGILLGESDVSMITLLPCSKNAFYTKKAEFFNLVYLGCAANNIISYNEILESIA